MNGCGEGEAPEGVEPARPKRFSESPTQWERGSIEAGRFAIASGALSSAAEASRVDRTPSVYLLGAALKGEARGNR